MDSPVIAIESGIPIPSQYARQSRFPFAQMKVGDSFLVGFDLKYAAKGAIQAYKKAHKGTNFAARTVDDGYRIWRTA